MKYLDRLTEAASATKHVGDEVPKVPKPPPTPLLSLLALSDSSISSQQAATPRVGIDTGPSDKSAKTPNVSSRRP
jgi:hypothetical protein